jgi:hypothetical protein
LRQRLSIDDRADPICKRLIRQGSPPDFERQAKTSHSPAVLPGQPPRTVYWCRVGRYSRCLGELESAPFALLPDVRIAAAMQDADYFYAVGQYTVVDKRGIGVL